MSYSKVVLALFVSAAAFSASRAPVVQKPDPVVSPAPIPGPTPKKKAYLTMGTQTGSNVDRVFAQKALDYVDAIIENGCLRAEMEKATFKTLERDPMPQLNQTQAIEKYFAGFPAAVDLRWYYKRFTSAIGYTYFYKDNVQGAATETRIWTNTKFLSSEKMYAAHLVHESSHQLRFGGFGHWSTHPGSFPYLAGDLAAKCIAQLK